MEKETNNDTGGRAIAIVFALILISVLGLIVRWQNIAADNYAECQKIRLKVINLQQQHPENRYEMPSCYL